MSTTPTSEPWITALSDAFARGHFVKATLSAPTQAAGDLKSLDIRPIRIKRVLKLSVTYHHKTRDVVKNYMAAEAAALLAEWLPTTFTTARLGTTEFDLSLKQSAAGFVLTRSAPSDTTPPALTHDRAKQHKVGARPYLHALGLADAAGNIHPTAQDKFRQINKYIEILDGLIRPLAAVGARPLRIIDMGAGKGYLTFALYDYITHTLAREAEVIGVETRADLVAKCNAIAAESGFAGLRFVEGTIAKFDCTGADVLIALHACDTATDDALHRAVVAGAEVIVVAPCCHKQIRRAMALVTDTHPLRGMLQYGTYVERLSEMLTDSMRAQLLEREGYRTNLFEFISGEHTPKNVMIVATKLAAPISEQQREKLQAELAETRAQFGIEYHQLERLLGVPP